MNLPRFSSGQFGALRFDQLNEAFDGIEEGSRSPVRHVGDHQRLPLVLASIVSYDEETLRHAWAEAVINEAGTAVALEKGRSSTFRDDPYYFPAMNPSGSEIPSGTVVPLVPKRRKDGRPIYVIAGGAGSVVDTVMILGTYQAIIDGQMWSYRVRKARFSYAPPLQWQTEGPDQGALNSCENAVDDVPFQSIGVGTIRPTGVSATRRPIKTGTVVVAAKRLAGWTFSIPNGYSYTCLNP